MFIGSRNKSLMIPSFPCRWLSYGGVATAILCLSISLPLQAQQSIYNPIPIPSNYEVSDTLSDRDIPTGEGGFARDYLIELKEGEQVAIDVVSDNFDAVVILLGEDGAAIAENDDGPDGSTNSLLFSRITETGKYIIRVRSFGETGSGKFTLKVTRLSPK